MLFQCKSHNIFVRFVSDEINATSQKQNCNIGDKRLAERLTKPMGLRALRSCLGIEAAVSVAEVMASWLLQALFVVGDLIS